MTTRIAFAGFVPFPFAIPAHRPVVSGIRAGIVARWKLYRARQGYRTMLVLDANTLRDIGLTRYDLECMVEADTKR